MSSRYTMIGIDAPVVRCSTASPLTSPYKHAYADSSMRMLMHFCLHTQLMPGPPPIFVANPKFETNI